MSIKCPTGRPLITSEEEAERDCTALCSALMPIREALAVESIAWDWIDRPITFVFRKFVVLSMDFVQVPMCWREVISTVFLIGVIALSPRGGSGNTWSGVDALSGV
jgi:hypothetical protein